MTDFKAKLTDLMTKLLAANQAKMNREYSKESADIKSLNHSHHSWRDSYVPSSGSSKGSSKTNTMTLSIDSMDTTVSDNQSSKSNTAGNIVVPIGLEYMNTTAATAAVDTI